MRIKFFVVLAILICNITFGQNYKTSNDISKENLTQFITNHLSANRPVLKLLGLNKTKEEMYMLYGTTPVHNVYFDILLTPKQDIYITNRSSHLANKFSDDYDYVIKKPSNQDAILSTGTYQLIKKGERLYLKGKIQAQNKNLQVRQLSHTVLEKKNQNFVLAGSSSGIVSDNQTSNKTVTTENPLQKLKERLDWQKEDITDVIYNYKYFSAENVPLFSYGNLKYKISPSNNFKGRNDVASNIQKMFYEAIKSTNRLTNDSEENFKASENQINVQLEIQKVLFSFKGKGYQCQIFINADINGHYKNPNSYEYKRNVPVTAKSNIFKNEMSKSESFNSALSNLKKEFRNFIFKREIIQIDFLRIETNKKGKVDKIIFKKPENFINTKKMNFLVLESSDLSINNNKVSITGKVGYCKFKGEIIGDEIICNANNKNKKAFAKYIDSQTELIGLSDF